MTIRIDEGHRCICAPRIPRHLDCVHELISDDPLDSDRRFQEAASKIYSTSTSSLSSNCEGSSIGTISTKPPPTETRLGNKHNTSNADDVDPNDNRLETTVSSSTNAEAANHFHGPRSLEALETDEDSGDLPRATPARDSPLDRTNTSRSSSSDSSVVSGTTANTSLNSEETISHLTSTESRKFVNQIPLHETFPEAERVVLDLRRNTKEYMYPFKNAPGLFVGLCHKFKPPSYQWTHWQREVEPRLWLDVQYFQKRHKRVKNGCVETPEVAIEFRMSGYASADGNQVTLKPRIWILYDHKRWEKKILKFVEELEWLTGEGFGKPEVHRGCPRLASLDISLETLQISSQEGYSLAEDVELFVHVEDPISTSACGLLCCATFMKNGDVQSQHVSRLGGLMSLDEKISSITTAHGFLKEIFQRSRSNFESWETLSEDCCTEKMSTSDSSLGSCSDSDGMESDEDIEGSQDIRNPICATFDQSIGIVDSETLAAISWVQLPIWSIRETSFLGASGRTMQDCIQAIKTMNSQDKFSKTCGSKRPQLLSTSPAARDFCFVPQSEAKRLHNHYEMEGPKSSPKKMVVSRFAKPEELSGGLVSLLLRPGTSTRGVLLPPGDGIFFGLYGVLIRVSKIVIDAPLGESVFHAEYILKYRVASLAKI